MVKRGVVTGDLYLDLDKGMVSWLLRSCVIEFQMSAAKDEDPAQLTGRGGTRGLTATK